LQKLPNELTSIIKPNDADWDMIELI